MEKRKTIGFLLDYTTSQYQLEILKGVESVIKKNNMNLYCFEGGILDFNYNFNLQRTHIYKIAANMKLDGIIILSGSICSFLDDKNIQIFFKQFGSIPIVSLGSIVNNYHSIITDNKKGMKDLIIHLIEDHKFKKFAFTKGKEEIHDSAERYKIFKETLKEHKIQINENHIINTDFIRGSGRIIADKFAKIVNEIDVIICINDTLAIEISDEFLKQGIRVPNDVAIVGFDNLDPSLYHSPALTTVKLSADEQGKLAAETLLNLLKNEKIHLIQKTKTELKIRESCGCIQQNINEIYFEKNNIENNFKESKNDKSNFIKKIIDEIIKNNIDAKKFKLKNILNDIFNSFFLSMKNEKKEIFISKWHQFLYLAETLDIDNKILNQILNYLHSCINFDTLEKNKIIFFEKLFRSAVFQVAEKSHKFNISKINKIFDTISLFSFVTSVQYLNFDIKLILDLNSIKLPEFGILSFYFSSLDIKNYKNSKLLYSYNYYQKEKFSKNQIKYSTNILLPENIMPKDRRVSFLIESLDYTEENVGYNIFEIDLNKWKKNLSIRRIIITTLQGALITNEVQKQKNILSNNLDKLRKVMGSFIQTMAQTVETRDPYTAGHQRRVSDLARSIAEQMKLSDDKIEAIRMASLIHDMGKIYVPSDILNRPGRLTDLEFEMIKTHVTVAHNILKNIDFPWDIAKIISQHHEKLDGSGYPNNLKSDQIMLEAKIICIADVVEAMASHRPYRAALGIEIALDEISKNKGILYDSDGVDACIYLFKNKNYKFK